MTTAEPTRTLDVKGLNCPMPVVRTSQAIDELEPGDVLAVHATDPGSVSDIAGWADGTDGVALVDQSEEGAGDDTVYTHRVRKTG